MLSSTYFTRVHSEVDGDLGVEYTVYRAKGNPMVLFSEIDGSALAAVHFLPAKKTSTAGSLIAERTMEGDTVPGQGQSFQGLINEDCEQFKFVITNLCSESHVNINIMLDGDAIKEVNPGGVNEINEVKPMNSYDILSNATNGNRAFILKMLERKITIAEDAAEVKSGKKSKSDSASFFVSVTPCNKVSELLTRFGTKTGNLWVPKTVWRCKEHIVVITPKPRGIGQSGIDDQLYQRQGYYNISSNAMSQHGSSAALLTSGGRAVSGSGGIRELSATMDVPFALEGSEEDDMEGVDEIGVACWGTRHCSNIDEQSVRTVHATREYQSSRGALSEPRATRTVMPVNSSLINESMAAQVIGGEYIPVRSEETFLSYEYDLTSGRCTLGLSVQPALHFVSEEDSSVLDVGGRGMALVDAAALIGQVKSKKFEDFLKRPIFKQDECVICKEGPPEVIYYTCAHAAVHKKCNESHMEFEATRYTKPRCPMCRTTIQAVLNMDGTPVKEAERPTKRLHPDLPSGPGIAWCGTTVPGEPTLRLV